MTTTKQYDDLNRLTQVSSQPGAAGLPAVAFNYNYNPANQRTQDKLADGSYWVYGYDTLGQVISGHKYFYDKTPVPGQQFDYDFDTIGNREWTKAGGDQTGANQRLANYAVNSLNQITSRDYPGTNDIIGAALATNAVTLNGQPVFHKWEYFWGTVQTNNTAAPAWLGAMVASGGGSTTGNVYLAQTPERFSYDADGNLTGDGRWTYSWDAENRLIGMAVNTAAGPAYQLAFAYDARGRRIQKAVTIGIAVTATDFLYDGWNLLAELQPNNTLIRSYVWGSDLSGAMQGAGGVGGLLEVSYHGNSTTNCFPAFDGNGNLAALVNAADGTVAANYEYGPFGEVIRATGPMAKANPIRFSTKYDDDESDLLYYGYRYYKPSTGTWLNKDLFGESGGANLSSFIGNDPIDETDYLGLYEADFHFYVIYYLLRAKCYSTSDAFDIAYYSQNVDDAPATDPEILGKEYIESGFTDTSAAQQLANFHFINSTPTRATVMADPTAMVRAFAALRGTSKSSAGSSLHTLADTWAHKGFTAFYNKQLNGPPNHPDLNRVYPWPPVGHAEFSHRPDFPYLRPGLAMLAAKTIYNIIPSQGCGCTPLPLSIVSTDLNQQFMVSASEYDRSMAAQRMIQMRFGEIVWDGAHTYDTKYDPGN